MQPPPPPQLCPSARELDDVELLVSAALGTPPRFDGADGLVTLVLPESVAVQAEVAGAVELVDPEGAPLAQVRVESTYQAGAGTGVEGAVLPRSRPAFGPFRRLYRTVEEVRRLCRPGTVTVPVCRPLTEPDLAQLRSLGAPLLLLVLTGQGTPTHEGRLLPAPTLVRATLAAAGLLEQVTVSATPLASRGPGREEEDRAMRQRVVGAFAPGVVVEPSGAGALPAEVREVVEVTLRPPAHQGLVVFFTGLSGSGKSTLARALIDDVLERGRRTVTSLDGDVVRRTLSAGLTFSKADREANIRRIGWVAAEIARHGGLAVCSPIAPYDATRKQVRAMVEEAGGAFFLVHVATPLEECERRDRKGLYARARAGEIPEFTGISSPYEVPDDAELVVDTTDRSVDEVLAVVLQRLHDMGHVLHHRAQ